MNLQRLWNDPVWSKVIAGIVLGSGALLLTTMPLSPVTEAVGASVVVVGTLLMVWTLLRSPVVWNFTGFLGLVGGGGDLRIVGFQTRGRNRSGKGIESVNGYLVSNIDNSVSESLRFVIGGTPVLPSSTTGIPPDANFQVMIPLFDMTQGHDGYMKEFDFLQRWGSFRFVVEMDGFRFERSFSAHLIAREIERFRKVVNPSPTPQVRVKQ